MGTLKIGSASNRAGVTIEPKRVLFNDNNVKYIKSGLTEIWSNIKALVPTMTSNTAPYGEIITSSYSANYEGYRAFDDNNETLWSTPQNQGANSYIAYKFTSPAIIEKVYISRTASNISASNLTLKIQGSNNGTDWKDLSDIFSFGKEEKYIEFNNENYYLYYALRIVTTSNGYGSVSSLQFYGSQLMALIPAITTCFSTRCRGTCHSWN